MSTSEGHVKVRIEVTIGTFTRNRWNHRTGSTNLRSYTLSKRGGTERIDKKKIGTLYKTPGRV